VGDLRCKVGERLDVPPEFIRTLFGGRAVEDDSIRLATLKYQTQNIVIDITSKDIELTIKILPDNTQLTQSIPSNSRIKDLLCRVVPGQSNAQAYQNGIFLSEDLILYHLPTLNDPIEIRTSDVPIIEDLPIRLVGSDERTNTFRIRSTLSIEQLFWQARKIWWPHCSRILSLTFPDGTTIKDGKECSYDKISMRSKGIDANNLEVEVSSESVTIQVDLPDGQSVSEVMDGLRTIEQLQEAVKWNDISCTFQYPPETRLATIRESLQSPTITLKLDQCLLFSQSDQVSKEVSLMTSGPESVSMLPDQIMVYFYDVRDNNPFRLTDVSNKWTIRDLKKHLSDKNTFRPEDFILEFDGQPLSDNDAIPTTNPEAPISVMWISSLLRES
jgi:hypothetical protein